MSSGDGVAVMETAGSGADGLVLSGVEGLAGGVGTGVAEGAPQATSTKIIVKLVTNDALIFMSMPPGSKRSQIYSDAWRDFTIPEKSSIITSGDDADGHRADT